MRRLNIDCGADWRVIGKVYIPSKQPTGWVKINRTLNSGINMKHI